MQLKIGEILQSSFKSVINEKLCIACGACTKVDNVEIKLNKKTGLFEPSSETIPQNFDYCPSVKVDFTELQRYIFDETPKDVYGVVHKVFLAQSKNFNRNTKASSGGLIKEIGKYYFEKYKQSEGIIALDEEGGLNYSAKLIRNFKEFDQLPGSIYHQVNFQNLYKILNEVNNPVAIVAIPCVLEGLYNYIYNFDKQAIDKIDLTIGLLCGWTYSHKSIEAIKQYHDFTDNIKKVSYRGEGPIGKLKLSNSTNQLSLSRRTNFSYQVAFDRSFNSPRCLLCVNHSNYLAEIVIGDAWLPSTLFTKTGISLVISRTKRASTIIEDMYENGDINLIEVSTEEILASQSKNIVTNSSALKRISYLKSINKFTPQFKLENDIFPNVQFDRSTVKEMKKIFLKQELIFRNKFKRLYLRKLVIELPSLLNRYIKWFVKRILRFESLFGNRKEIKSNQYKDFI